MLGKSKLDGIGPRAKRNFQTDVFWLDAGMWIVTGLAASALGTVDMQIMKVVIAVTKVGQARSPLITGDVFVMTLKTEGVLFPFVGRVEFRRKVFVEEPGVERAVGFMTRLAVSILHRPVQVFTALDIVTQIRVTPKAEVLQIRL